MGEPTRLAVLHRAVPRWRRPILEKLAHAPEFTAEVYFGADVPGAKHTSASELDRSIFKELRSLPLGLSARGERLTMPLTPSVFWRLFRFRPDVVLMEGASNAAMNTLAMVYCRIFGVPHVWWSLGELPGRERTALQRMFRYVATLPERSASGVIAYSERGATYFHGAGLNPDIVTVATNVVDTSTERLAAAASADGAREVRSRYAPDGESIALFVGALTTVKKVDRLVEAARCLFEREVPVICIVVGDGPIRAELEASVSSPNVHFVGEKLDDVAAWFQAADVFVLPGLGGLSISQAMTNGLPVVAGDADGTERDLVQHGVNGLLVGDADGRQLADAIERVLFEGDLRREMSEASKALVETHFNIERQAALITDAILRAERLGARHANRR